MPRCPPHELTRTSLHEVLSGYNNTALQAWQGSFVAEAKGRVAAWRLIELNSVTGTPVDWRVVWTSGGGEQEAWVSTARSTRVCVYAQTLRLQTRNNSASSTTVSATIATTRGALSTDNVWEVRSLLDADGSDEIVIPPYARRVRVDCGDRTKLDSVTVTLTDAYTLTRAQLLVSELPSDGLPIGSADKVTLSNTGANVLCRAVFHLAL